MAKNKVQYGLKNVHYATFTEEGDTIVYDAPVRTPGAVTLSLTPRGEMTEFYADDMLYYSASSNDGYDGTFEVALIPEQFAIDALGETKEEVSGILTERADARQKPFALLFEFDGDVKATRHVLYNCSANRPTVTGETTTNTKEPNTNELAFVASARSTDYAVKARTSPDTPEEVYDVWYDSVFDAVPAGA